MIAAGKMNVNVVRGAGRRILCEEPTQTPRSARNRGRPFSTVVAVAVVLPQVAGAVQAPLATITVGL